MENELLIKLADKSITKKDLFLKVKQDFSLIQDVVNGTSSKKPAIRYGCGKVLMDLSKNYPEKIYPYMDYFIDLLDGKYRVLIWNAIAIIANLTKVDTKKKFEIIFDKYFSFINNDYMITVANVVGNAGKIVLAKPNLVAKVTNELLKVEDIKTSPHLTEECKKVIAEHAILAFNQFFDIVEQKEKVIEFVKRQAKSPRKSLRKKADDFLKKWN
jgi:hypothetical protein